jgi:DNA polymerase III epsilon subunit-like protein
MKSSAVLTIELVPPLAWGRNVRAVVASETWNALRWHFKATSLRFSSTILKALGRSSYATPTCAYCGAERDTLDLHEVWDYDDAKRIQRLTGLRPVCPKCHLVKHLGYANTAGRRRQALRHLADVNNWTAEKAHAHCRAAFALWRRRAGIAYSQDLSYLTKYMPAGQIHLDWLDNPRTWVGSRLDAIIWARRLLNSDAVIVDTETTGLLCRSKAEVIELAAIDMRGKQVYRGLFKPRYKIPASVIAIHGITNARVRWQPSFAQRAQAIRSALQGRIIITYNARFDREVIRRTCSLHKVDSISARWECAMHAYRAFCRSGFYLRLPGGSHRALADCRATLRLLVNMAKAVA